MPKFHALACAPLFSLKLTWVKWMLSSFLPQTATNSPRKKTIITRKKNFISPTEFLSSTPLTSKRGEGAILFKKLKGKSH